MTDYVQTRVIVTMDSGDKHYGVWESQSVVAYQRLVENMDDMFEYTQYTIHVADGYMLLPVSKIASVFVQKLETSC